MTVRKCVVIASHPRSGTHLTIDFIRRNFPNFNCTPHLWESASKLYLDLDEIDRAHINSPALPLSTAGYLIAMTHLGRMSQDIEEKLARLGIGNYVYIYPFRLYSKTMKSFAEFSGFKGTIKDFLDSQDRFFGFGCSVADCAALHAHRWLETDAAFLNIEELIRDPDHTALKLGALLREPHLPLDRRLPRKKRWSGGKISELAERLTGRESTSVNINYGISWRSKEESEWVDARFRESFSAMDRRRLN